MTKFEGEPLDPVPAVVQIGINLGASNFVENRRDTFALSFKDGIWRVSENLSVPAGYEVIRGVEIRCFVKEEFEARAYFTPGIYRIDRSPDGKSLLGVVDLLDIGVKEENTASVRISDSYQGKLRFKGARNMRTTIHGRLSESWKFLRSFNMPSDIPTPG